MKIFSIADNRQRRAAGERGAAAVEFAILAPLFFMLVFGMFTGGLAYNEKSQLTYAAREGARYAATLPLTQNFTGPVDADNNAGCVVASLGGATSGPLWACAVAKDAIGAAFGDLNPAIPNRFVCVAVIQQGTPDTVLTDSANAQYHYDTAGGTTGDCFNDNGSVTDQRVHVLVRRDANLNAVLFHMALTINSSAIARLETLPPAS